MFVIKGFIRSFTYKHIKEYIQVRGLTNVMFVVKHSLVQVTYKDIIRIHTDEKPYKCDVCDKTN